ncbi:MAG TPA: site-specific DNA-methyltransferase [Candidatus Saccharimonadaceae bacterium]|jgi:DNA modification methylase|nr:site-specific DNA-methyltransferase [Candidatus Saccharimonadaceae bacterium]
MEDVTIVRKLDSWAIARVRPYEKNARLHSDADVRKLAAHVIRHGFNKPIEVDEEGIILCGHRRLAAAQLLGMARVPVIQHSHLDAARKREYRLADNRLTLEGEWDEELLAAEMEGIREQGGELEFTGFSDAELRDLELDATGIEESPVPEPPAIPISRRVDLWHLGSHRVLCGDATAPSDLGNLLHGELADCVWTDPPYNVAYEGKTSERLTIENDRMGPAEFHDFLRLAFSSTFEVTREGAPIYVAHPDTASETFRVAFREAGWELKQCLVWNKNVFVMGRQDYHWKHEPILYGWKPGAAHTWVGGRDKCTVIDMDRPSASPEHPTMKPVALVAAMLRNSAAAGSTVLDPFGGSGSTLMACDALGLQARLLELDPRFVDVIIRRWQDATGEAATLKGVTPFDVVSEQRSTRQ